MKFLKSTTFFLTFLFLGVNVSQSQDSASSKDGEVVFNGVKLDLPKEILSLRKGQIPVNACVCVQDSPSNPCRCGSILWLEETSILKSGDTKHTDSSGRTIEWFSVPETTDVELLKVETMPISYLGERHAKAQAQQTGSQCGYMNCKTEPASVPCGSSTVGNGTMYCDTTVSVCDYGCTGPGGTIVLDSGTVLQSKAW